MRLLAGLSLSLLSYTYHLLGVHSAEEKPREREGNNVYSLRENRNKM